MSVQRLLNAGFERIGTWCLLDSGDGIRLEGDAAREAGVYAYVVDGRVRYVGSAQRGLRRRFRHYAVAKTLRTSARVRGEIIDCLKSGSLVEVYTLQPPEMEWRGLPVDLVAGLEEGLIRSLKPAWNLRSNRKDGGAIDQRLPERPSPPTLR